MNKQKPDSPNAIHWTRIINPDGTRQDGYTWNVAGGCKHGCQWQMPDGKIASCYAKDVAEGIAKSAYPQGFEHHYFHPDRLEEPLSVKKPSGIFLDSMADLLGAWVSVHEITQVLDTCRRADWHTFFLLTKNAPRAKLFQFPSNIWVGASSPPDFMYGKKLTDDQKQRMLSKSLESLLETRATVKWMSFEPLSWDVAHIVRKHKGAIQWAVIGAASNGRTKYQPDEIYIRKLVIELDKQGVPIFFKGNLKGSPWVKAFWREEFPSTEERLHQPGDEISYKDHYLKIISVHSSGYRANNRDGYFVTVTDTQIKTLLTDKSEPVGAIRELPGPAGHSTNGSTPKHIIPVAPAIVKTESTFTRVVGAVREPPVCSTNVSTSQQTTIPSPLVGRAREGLRGINKIINAHVLEYLKSIPDNSVHTSISSPPYYGLRDYGTDPIDWPAMKYAPMPGIPEIEIPAMTASLGQEPTLEAFIGHLVLIYREIYRVLHPTGTAWVNMGDCYATSVNGRSAADTKAIGNDDRTFRDKPFSTVGNGLKPKDLVGQPWRLALALQADGWYLRSDIIWHKTNSMPESVNDRPTNNHEYVFLLARSSRYYYDREAIAEPVKHSSFERNNRGYTSNHKNLNGNGVPPGSNIHSMHKARANGEGYAMPAKKNKRTVWTISTKGFPDAHFATFPIDLITPMVLAGCPPKVCPKCLSPYERIVEKTFIPQEDVSLERGIKGAPGQKPQYDENRWEGYQRGSIATITTGWQPTCSCEENNNPIPGRVLDPFMGSGTTALAAKENGRDYLGCDLNPEYVEMANKRLAKPIEVDMFNALGFAIPIKSKSSVTEQMSYNGNTKG